jgi:hypothetical protein
MSLTELQRWALMVAFVFGGCSAMAVGQATRSITVESTTVLSSDAPRTPHVESWLAANPRDPKNLIAVADAINGTAASGVAIYYTKNGGKTWHRSKSSEASGYFHGTDPSVSFGPNGDAYFVNEDNSRIFAYRSENGGESWQGPFILDGDDHPVIAVDASDGAYHNRVYYAASGVTNTPQGDAGSSIEFGYSDDGIEFRQRNFLVSQKAQDGKQYWPSITDLAVAPDGTVVLIYSGDAPAPDGQFSTTTEYWIITSSNGGRTFTEPHHVVTSTLPADQDRAGRIICFSKVAIDSSSGPRRGRIYLAYPTLVDGWERIKVVHSDDYGQTWENSAEAGHDSTHTDQGVPAIAVSGDGIVGVSWYDRRKATANDCFQGYFSASLDGGLTFLPAIALQDSQTCPTAPGNQRLHGAYSHADGGKWLYSVDTAASRFPNGGETQGLVGTDSGEFQLVWTNGETGVMQLVSSAVRVGVHPLGRDVTDRVQAKISPPEFNAASHQLSVQVSLTNLSREPMVAPLCLELLSADSGSEVLHAFNAQNSLGDAGAIWLLNPSHDADRLDPSLASAPTTLVFESKIAPTKSAATNVSADFGMMFHIFDGCRK